MKRPSLLTTVNLLLGIYSAVPLALLVAFYAFVVRARMELGSWPQLMVPDPKDLSFASTHMDTVFWLFVLTVCCALPWLLTAFLRVRLAPDGHHSRSITLLGLPWLLVLIVWFVDPGLYVMWFLD
jgi:hypothetical protein